MDHGYLWECKCDCGNTCNALAAGLKSHKIRSCGCLRYQQRTPYNKIEPSLEDIFWAAGVYEGEGSCGKGGRYCNISVTQKDPWLVHKLQDLFGGSVRRYKNRKYSYYHIWSTSGARAAKFITYIYDLLSPRRQLQIDKYITKEERMNIMKTIYRSLEIKEVDNGYTLHLDTNNKTDGAVPPAFSSQDLVVLSLPQLLKMTKTFFEPTIVEGE